MNDFLERMCDEQEDILTRYAAFQALVRLGHRETAIKALLALALRQMVNIGGFQAAAEISDKLTGDPNEFVEALLALGHNKQMDPLVRYVIAVSLDGFGLANEAAEILLSLKDHERMDKDWIRWPAAVASMQLERPGEAAEAILAIVSEQQEDEIMSPMDDERMVTWADLSAAESLGRSGHASEDALSRLMALACDNQVPMWVRCDVIEMLGRMGRASKAVLVGLISLAQDERAPMKVRNEAYEALKQLANRADE